MIRFLQTDNRMTKAIFVVIIGAASVSMVVYLIPGLTGQGAAAADTYAVIYPHWYSRYLSPATRSASRSVEKMARQQLQQQRYPDNPMILRLFEQRVGQQMVQQQVLLAEADKLGIRATDDDVGTVSAHRRRPARSSSPTASSSARTVRRSDRRSASTCR